MSEPWTPGPWEVEYDILEGDWGYRVYEAGGDRSIDRPGDARLIAAAPEMARFVEAAAEDHNDDTGWCNLHDVAIDSAYHREIPFAGTCFVDDARALLSRIRGA